MRLDVYLAEHGFAESRERAKRLIVAGQVLVNGKTADKPSAEVTGEPEIEVLSTNDFVGRGGQKLEEALRVFGVDPKGVRALDIGASTGGFTDCLLRHGAVQVVALDAGCDQLHPKLRADSRVINIEKYNARNLAVADVGRVSLAVMDVSFISQTYILPRLPEVLTENGCAITLIKPQFEAGRGALNKKGLVKSPRDRIMAIQRVLTAAAACGLICRGLAPSPIRGGDGNEEYLAYFTLGEVGETVNIAVEKTVLEGAIAL
ncbi:MAG: TlyA family RNA methyltransferase [Clostridia bacterium]|nr:TlyA family RNA methyltransferase [Clostridia bacterium]